MVTPEILAAMGRLEEAVHKSDGDSVRARWESGRYMLTLKAGRQLPRGVLDELAEKLGVVRQELGARMKFAEMYPTEDKLSTAVERFRTWTAIRQGGLKEDQQEDQEGDEGTTSADDDSAGSESDDRRVEKTLRRVLTTVENIEATAVHVENLGLLTKIASAIQRLQEAVEYLRKEVA